MMNKIKATTGRIVTEVLSGLLILTVLAFFINYASYIESHYIKECEVIEVGNNAEVVLLDGGGSEWLILADNVTEGDVVKAIFYDNHTEVQTDDVVENLKKIK